MAKNRKRDRRRPAQGSRGGGQVGLWLPTDFNEETTTTVNLSATIIGIDDNAFAESAIEFTAIGLQVGQIIPGAGVWVRHGVGDWRECVTLEVASGDELRATFPAGTVVTGKRIAVAPFGIDLGAGMTCNCAGAIATVG